jgi:hypothetical protein
MQLEKWYCSGEDYPMTLENIPSTLILIAIYFIYGTTFTLAGGLKVLEKGVPAWFTDQFSKTFLKTFPGINIAYWSIALMECAVPVLLVISLVRTEFLPGQSPLFLQMAVALSAIIFGVLGFGLRLVNDFAGAANSFFYFGAALITHIYLKSA